MARRSRSEFREAVSWSLTNSGDTPARLRWRTTKQRRESRERENVERESRERKRMSVCCQNCIGPCALIYNKIMCVRVCAGMRVAGL
ncbi:hypothetical protein M6B38_305245 [Iris pallida]|uniref:Uncharacterized protein n=1 Tax=Iris pallida TaxID=29817 RepID=A0AAX6HM92_IRIPA|nr:hypothetical protein M6B38_305245 [Iris pallida]